VGGIHAVSLAAQVVEIEAGGNRADVLLIDDTVSALVRVPLAREAVALPVLRQLPDPTRREIAAIFL
jgi:hypothetical protein